MFIFIFLFSTVSTSLRYVERKRKENAFGAMIGWRNGTNQSECRTRPGFDLDKRKTNSY